MPEGKGDGDEIGDCGTLEGNLSTLDECLLQVAFSQLWEFCQAWVCVKGRAFSNVGVSETRLLV